MKKLLTAFLGGVILIAGINCTKDSPYRIKKSPNVFFRGVGIDVNGEARSYSVIRQYITNPKKKNQRLIGGTVGTMEFWGNNPDGQVILKVTNNQSCTNTLSFTIDQGNLAPQINRSKVFAPFAQDTFLLTMVEIDFAFVSITTNTICPIPIFDLDSYGPPNNTFGFDIAELPMHFKTFDQEGTNKVSFTITSLKDADHINIEGSIDGKTWRTLKVIQAKDIVINQPYSVEVHLK
ncbi:MAG TPA: hypothetical protein VFD24_08555 [Chitinophagaceae bacterium]|jgi:hypothetical protein|nr:hypothetical protein [Chitinophagaceae bacterium]